MINENSVENEYGYENERESGKLSKKTLRRIKVDINAMFAGCCYFFYEMEKELNRCDSKLKFEFLTKLDCVALKLNKWHEF